MPIDAAPYACGWQSSKFGQLPAARGTLSTAGMSRASQLGHRQNGQHTSMRTARWQAGQQKGSDVSEVRGPGSLQSPVKVVAPQVISTTPAPLQPRHSPVPRHSEQRSADASSDGTPWQTGQTFPPRHSRQVIAASSSDCMASILRTIARKATARAVDEEVHAPIPAGSHPAWRRLGQSE